MPTLPPLLTVGKSVGQRRDTGGCPSTCARGARATLRAAPRRQRSLAPHWRPMAASAARTAACCAVVCAGVLVRLACAWLLDAGESIAARVELATPVDRIELCA